MIVLLILNIGIAFLLIWANPHNRLNQYLGCLYFLCGVDVFLKISRDFLIYNSSFNIVIGSMELRDKIMVLFYIINSFTYFLVPLFYLIFAIKYSNLSDWWNSKLKYLVSFTTIVIFIAIILFMDVWFPINYYAYNLRSGILLLPFYLWNISLLLISNYLLVKSYREEIKPRQKREKLLMCIVFAPPISFFIATRYLFTLLRLQDTYSPMNLIEFVFCLLFLYCFKKYGLMGLKINIEHYDINRYKESVTSGAAIINHTLKNEITKMSICLQSIRHYGQPNMDILKNMEIMDNSIEHLKSLVCQYNKVTERLKLEITRNNICFLVNETVESIRPFLQGKDINIMNLCEENIELLCDKTHISKALENILANSIDSIESQGSIKISTEKTQKIISIIIEDTGKGISEENLKHVKEPHFTTKKNKNNFGLGLFYCSQIIEEHGGFLGIQSNEGSGTKASLNFPASKLPKK